MRFALDRDEELAPYADHVRANYDQWLAEQDNRGKTFTPEQRRWLDMMREHIATSLEIELEDFDLTPFAHEGGLAKASKLFGNELRSIVQELNEVLAA